MRTMKMYCHCWNVIWNIVKKRQRKNLQLISLKITIFWVSIWILIICWEEMRSLRNMILWLEIRRIWKFRKMRQKLQQCQRYVMVHRIYISFLRLWDYLIYVKVESWFTSFRGHGHQGRILNVFGNIFWQKGNWNIFTFLSAEIRFSTKKVCYRKQLLLK